MPVGPLAISDEVPSSLMKAISASKHRRGPTSRRKPLIEHPAFAVIDLLLNEYKRPGKAAGGVFYEYPLADRNICGLN